MRKCERNCINTEQKIRDRQLAAPTESENLQDLVVNELKTKKHTATEGLVWLVRCESLFSPHTQAKLIYFLQIEDLISQLSLYHKTSHRYPKSSQPPFALHTDQPSNHTTLYQAGRRSREGHGRITCLVGSIGEIDCDSKRLSGQEGGEMVKETGL
jgi:hypothetical protein